MQNTGTGRMTYISMSVWALCRLDVKHVVSLMLVTSNQRLQQYVTTRSVCVCDMYVYCNHQVSICILHWQYLMHTCTAHELIVIE